MYVHYSLRKVNIIWQSGCAKVISNFKYGYQPENATSDTMLRKSANTRLFVTERLKAQSSKQVLLLANF